jgi:hypothetical protein
MGGVQLVLDGEEPQEVARTVGLLMSLVVAEELVAVSRSTVRRIRS